MLSDFFRQMFSKTLDGLPTSYAIPVRQDSALPSASFPQHLAMMQLTFS
jgi:hypothetical protein